MIPIMATSRQLDIQLHEIAWSIAERTRPAIRPVEPWDRDQPSTVEERRAGSLALMSVYTQMIKVLQRRLDLAIKEALTLEADYGDVGAACGVSRQAARQRWLRHCERYEFPKVRLVGGPGDGEWARPQPGTDIIRTLWEQGPARPSGEATYKPSAEDPDIYLYVGSKNYNWAAAPTG
jgi:hypothetical protein